ncbi:MAG: hypothetical protein K1X28_08195 [Parachlamydiales bacterium]|nr:hypothetical protein [Parachlamydiales bacterium]
MAAPAVNKHWLLAEDNEFLALVAFQSLDKVLPKHHKIICVKNGDEVAKAVQKLPFEAWELDESRQKLIRTQDKVVDAWHGFILDGNMPYSKGPSIDAGVLLAREIRRTFQRNVLVFSCSSDRRAEFSDRELFDDELPKFGLIRAIPPIFSRYFPEDFGFNAQL